MAERKYWNEEMEQKSWEEMMDIQFLKLTKQIDYIYNNSPLYYRKKFDEIGVKPGDIKTWDDFYSLPVMGNKEMERKSQEDSMRLEGHSWGTALCAPKEKVVGVTATGGTTGVPTFSYLYTEQDLKINDEIWTRVFWTAGIRPGDIVANIFALSMHAGGWPVSHALTSMGACPIPIGAEAGTERILMMIDAVRPKALVGTIPLMEHLIERCPDILKKDIGELGIKILLGAGAPGAGIPSIRKKLEDNYGAKVFDSMGGGQGTHMVSCDSKEYHGLHIICAEYFVWPQDLIDSDGKHIPLKNGSVGQGIHTAIDQEAKPFFKYAYGDMIQVFTEECPGCGFKGLRLKLVGRADEMLIVKGVNIYPSAVKGVVNSFLPRVTGEIRIVLDAPGPSVQPPMKIRVEHSAGMGEAELETLKAELTNTIKNKLEVRPDIELVPPQTFERAGGVSAKGTLIEKTYQEN